MFHLPSFLRMQPAGCGTGHAFRAALVFALLCSPWAWSSHATEKALRIFFVDVEGGQATLFVTPQHHSLLIDAGWPGNNGRDADRIVAVARKAGIKKIDDVLITHFHNDHVGGLPQLVARIPVGTVIDHGDNRESTDAPTVQVWQAYQELLAAKKFNRLTVKPGESLPIGGIQATVISSDGTVIDHPLTGAGQENASCKNAEQFPADQTENRRSLGTLITFGKLKILDLGDLTRDKELELVCPINKVGAIDVYIVSHHGWYQSNSAAFLNAIAPRVAIMDNGAKKGGTPSAWDIIEKSPRLENLWQLHFSEEGGAAHNVAPEFIANPEGPDAANYLELTAWPDGSFEVFNSRTQKTVRYPAR
jgi:beta-lactamase superfamily II metal-dependent hydrolase